MTVAQTPRKAGPYLGNGVATSFPFGFKVFAKTDVEVVRADPNGIEAVLVLDSDYSVVLNADQDANPGGTITYPILGGTAPLPAGWRLAVLGSMAPDQETDITNVGRFLPNVIENALDKLTILVQQAIEQLTRSVQVPVSSDTDPRALIQEIVQAAALAQAALDQVQEIAEQFGDVANAVEIVTEKADVATAQATIATGAASAAVTASDVALARGRTYATPAAGVDAGGTPPGVGLNEYFTVVSAADQTSLDLYRNVAGNPVQQVGREIPSAGAVTALEEATRLAIEQPNVFSRGQLTFDLLPNFVNSIGTVETVNGVHSLKIESTGGATSARGFYRFPVSAFPSGLVSASFLIDKATDGTSGSLTLIMRDAGGAILKQVSFGVVPNTAITSTRKYAISSATIEPGTANIDVDLLFAKSTVPVGRSFNVRGMLASDGPSSTFRAPAPAVRSINYFLNPALTEVGATLYEASRVVEDGENVLLMTTAGLKQVFYDTPATGVYAIGSTITVQAEAKADAAGTGTSVDVSIICLDASGVAIGAPAVPAYTVPDVYQKQTVVRTVPALTATVRIRFVKRAGPTVGRFRRVAVSSDSPLAGLINGQVGDPPTPSTKRYVVSPGGDFQTVQAGIDAAKPFGTVIVREGDYPPFSVSGFYGRILAYRNERVRIIGGIELAGITKTGGAAKVYQAALAAKPKNYVWEHDTPDVSTLITAAERHPLQQGLTYRLPSTRILEAASIAAVDAAPAPAWFWDAGVLYFSTSDGNAPGARKIIVPRAAAANFSAVQGGTGDEIVDITGIRSMYGYNGFRFTGCSSVRLNACDALCNAEDGMATVDTPFVQYIRPRAGGNGNDGTNGHGVSVSTYNSQLSYWVVDPWCHDNWDDGDSLHERHLGSYQGGLWEYNGSGVATAYGAHVTMLGGLARKNGTASGNGNPSPKNLGISSIGAAVDGGVGTQVICFGTVSEDNGTNFSADAADNSIQCINTKSYRATAVGYSAMSGAAIKLRDSTDTGSVTAKAGAVTVENTTVVV